MFDHLKFHILGEGTFDGRISSTQFKKFKLLRALTIEGLNPSGTNNDKFFDFVCIVLEMFKLQIGKLIHLRYLCLKNTIFDMLPSSLANLEHLETLDVRSFKGFWIRNVLRKMKKLRYLYLPDEMLDLQCCKPQLLGLNNLEILVNFDTRYCEAKDICKLSKFQALEASAYDENECQEIIKFVSNSNGLKHADLYFWSSVYSEKWLILVEKLFQSDVGHLILDSYLGFLPEYKANFFKNLVELVLRNSRIERDLMGTWRNSPA